MNYYCPCASIVPSNECSLGFKFGDGCLAGRFSQEGARDNKVTEKWNSNPLEGEAYASEEGLAT